MEQMPADRFTFTVRVCREIDLGGVLCLFADPAEDIAPAADRDVFQVKIMIDVNAELAFWKITHMALGRFDFISFSEIFPDGLGLCGRFDDDQFLFCGRHDIIPPAVDYCFIR